MFNGQITARSKSVSDLLSLDQPYHLVLPLRFFYTFQRSFAYSFFFLYGPRHPSMTPYRYWSPKSWVPTNSEFFFSYWSSSFFLVSVAAHLPSSTNHCHQSFLREGPAWFHQLAPEGIYTRSFAYLKVYPFPKWSGRFSQVWYIGVGGWIARYRIKL